MRIGGSGTVSVDVIPSGAGTMRLNDLVSERDGVLMSLLTVSPAISAQFSCAQILNVAASGRRLLIDGLWFVGATGTEYQLRSHNTALANDVGAWLSINPSIPAGNAHSFHESLVALPGTLIVAFPKLATDVVDHWMFPFPMMLDENEGLVVTINLVQREVACNFIGREV